MTDSYADIQFKFECFPPFGTVVVLASKDGTGILILDCNDDEIELDDLSPTDKDRIKSTVNLRAKEWADHDKAMEEQK